jgi:hypothetical protein
VLPNAPREIGSRTNVKGAIRLASEEVDVKHRFQRPAWVPTFVGMDLLGSAGAEYASLLCPTR